MNIKLQRNNFFQRARIIAVLFAGIFLIPVPAAELVKPASPGRFLFIFETSGAMKNRVEAVQKALNIMLATSMGGQLHSGDSIGVWTFGQDLAAGNYPLQTWDADKAPVIAASLAAFVGGQHYAKAGRFEAVQPLLNQVVQGSERLTVLVFCDGTMPVAGTPFDASINQAFAQKGGDQSKAHQPFIILLRSQRGKFTGCTMNFPPASVNVPEFPPLPPPPAPKVIKATNPPPPLIITNIVAPLVIIGTKPAPPPETNTQPTNAPILPTNSSGAPTTNQIVAKIIPPVPTNAPALTPDNSGADNKKPWFVVAGLLGAVALTGIIVRLRSHRRETSLITRSMNHRR